MKAWFQNLIVQFTPESKENAILEAKLYESYSELKTLESKNPTLSPQFQPRFQAQLDAINQEKAKSVFVLADLIQGRRVQYSLSFVLLLALGFVSFSRSNTSPGLESDSAGVVTQSRFVQDTNTSLELTDSFKRKEVIDSLRKNPETIHSFKELEEYYSETGRNSAAEEIHSLIEASVK